MRLIDADALKERIRRFLSIKSLDDLLPEEKAIVQHIDRMPTVDAVPVVRCKDCLHNRACEIQYHAQAGDLFFCGAAERKDGEGHESVES